MDVWQIFQKITMTAGTVASIIFGIWSLFTHLMRSIGMFKIARRRKIRGAWLAWFPIANEWILGAIGDQYQREKYGPDHDPKRRVKLLVVALLIQSLVFVGPAMTAITKGMSILEILEALKQVDGGWLIMGSLGAAVFGMCVGFLFIIQMIIQYKAYYNLFASCKPKLAVLFLMLSILTPANPFLVLGCSKHDEGMPATTEE